MQDFADGLDQVFVWAILLAIIAAVVSTKSSGNLVTDLGSAVSALIGIVVNPVTPAKK
jgi:hypothetical protein